MLSRRTAYDADLTRALVQGCTEACRSCGDERERHEQVHEQVHEAVHEHRRVWGRDDGGAVMSTAMSDQQGGQGPAPGEHGDKGHDGKHMRSMYLRFAAMITTSMVVMYFVMYVGTWQWDHVTFSESRVFMALTMGGAMGLVMIAWMLNMYRSVTANLAVVAASLLLLAGGVFLDRSQATVDDTGWMSAMIPHHSLAITRSVRADIDDARVCQLAADIIAAQKREIREMQWLINDIQENGEARTAVEAQARQVPEFEVSDLRDCPTG